MPHFVTPNSHGTIQEFNACHTKHSGEFCSGSALTRVGITSQRPVGAEGHKSNRQVFHQMREFEGTLKALPGVTNVRVQPGLGSWEGGSEASWVVSYRGNGAATKLLARTAQTFDQDAVLMMKGCRGRRCDPAVDLRFDRAVTIPQRNAIQQILVANGMGGWSWLKSEGKTVLRMVSVPAWGGNSRKHIRGTRNISAGLSKLGLTHRVRIKSVRATVLDASNYATV